MKKNGMHLYQQIQDTIIGRIHRQELKPGDRLPSEHEMAAQLRVSRLTVRKAYTTLIEKGLLNAVQGKGTFVSSLSGLSLSELGSAGERGFLSKKVIGVIFPEITVFFGPILKELEELASRNNYALNIMFNDSFDRESNAVSTMLANHVDGVIINPRRDDPYKGNQNYIRLVESGIPTVMVGKPPFDIHCDCVMCDDISGSYRAVRWLIQNGHRRILRLYTSDDDAEAILERGEGFRRATEALKERDPKSVEELDCLRNGWMNELLAAVNGPDPVTAIFTDSDTFATQAHMFLTGQGISIPDRVTFLSFNSIDLCKQFGICMPSVDVPKTAMGRCAFELMQEKLEAPPRSTVHIRHAIFQPILNLT